MRIASIQMEVSPAPVADRLTRAEGLVAQAAQAGAELVVLPELFNTGYTYADDNFNLAESIRGRTAAWMKATAARLDVHLAGSILLRDGGDIYDALLLFAPDGQMWRYDKQFPWGWERAYFRPNKHITIARTGLGDFGLMICWDVAHRSLWRKYAGLVDLLVISSCPPDVTQLNWSFPGGKQVTLEQMGFIMASIKGKGSLVFDEMLSQQTAWLGVPAVSSGGCGIFQTTIPNGQVSLLSILPTAPRLVKYLFHMNRSRMACEMIPCCKIVAADGRVLAQLTQAQGENFTTSEVILADEKPSPGRFQPKSPLPWTMYGLSDYCIPWLSLPVYQKGLRLLRDRLS